MENELEDLREQLNCMLDSKEYSYGDILKISEELDKLIVKYYNAYQ